MSRNSNADRARGERMLAQALEHVRQAEMAAEAACQALRAGSLVVVSGGLSTMVW